METGTVVWDLVLFGEEFDEVVGLFWGCAAGDFIFREAGFCDFADGGFDNVGEGLEGGLAHLHAAREGLEFGDAAAEDFDGAVEAVGGVADGLAEGQFLLFLVGGGEGGGSAGFELGEDVVAGGFGGGVAEDYVLEDAVGEGLGERFGDAEVVGQENYVRDVGGDDERGPGLVLTFAQDLI